MIKDAHQIGDERPAFQAPFQEQILAHWRTIQKDRRYPDKRDFRPQMFPRFLPQLALVSVSEGKAYQDRLTGTAVTEVLRLNGAEDQLVSSKDAKVRKTLSAMLGAASESGQPMYFEGQFTPDEAMPIDFTALVLPFSHNGDTDVLDTLLLAFDFGRMPAIQAIDAIARKAES